MAEQAIKELTRKQRVWVCNECSAEYPNIPSQCKCGALAAVFDEKTVQLGQNEKMVTYKVETNIIYEGKQIDKGTLVKLVEKDYVTKDMLKNKVISAIKPTKEDLQEKK